MAKEKKQVEWPKDAFTYFRSPKIMLVTNQGDTFRGRIVKDYKYEIIFVRPVKDKNGKLWNQEMIVPKHSIYYVARNVERD